MNKRITYRHMESTPVLEEFSNKHLARIEKLLVNERSPIYLYLTLEGVPNHAHHQVELLLKTPHYDLVAHHEGPDMYTEIERVVDTMISELKRAKEKLLDKERNQDSYKSA